MQGTVPAARGPTALGRLPMPEEPRAPYLATTIEEGARGTVLPEPPLHPSPTWAGSAEPVSRARIPGRGYTGRRERWGVSQGDVMSKKALGDPPSDVQALPTSSPRQGQLLGRPCKSIESRQRGHEEVSTAIRARTSSPRQGQLLGSDCRDLQSRNRGRRSG